MPTIEMVRLFKYVSAKPTPVSPGRRGMREFLLRSLESELQRRAEFAARFHGVARAAGQEV